jgi:hypothetical protein
MPKVSSDSKWPYIVIPALAGIQSFQSRGTRDWTSGSAEVTGREKVIIFGNCYHLLFCTDGFGRLFHNTVQNRFDSMITKD